VLLLGVGGFFLLRGGGDDDDDDAAATTTTEEQEEETTTTEDQEEETTTTEDQGGEDDDFVEVFDDTNQLRVEVPVDWVDVDGRPIADPQSGGQIPNVQAAPDLASFRTTVDTSGLSYSLISTQTQDFDTTINFLMQQVGFDRICTDAGRFDYDDGVFAGRIQRLENCGNVGTSATFVVANPKDGASLSVEINFQLTADEDPAVGDHILQTFFINE
jgi:hypothetical protein